MGEENAILLHRTQKKANSCQAIRVGLKAAGSSGIEGIDLPRLSAAGLIRNEAEGIWFPCRLIACVEVCLSALGLSCQPRIRYDNNSV